jgi:hypothetical protein
MNLVNPRFVFTLQQTLLLDLLHHIFLLYCLSFRYSPQLMPAVECRNGLSSDGIS